MKKIKLPLEMANGVMVRTLDELKENWDLEKVVGYFGDGRLVTWLNDRYYTDLAEQVQKITAKGAEAQRQLCEVFGMEFKQDEVVDAEELAERKRKFDILRQFTSDDEILKNVDHVAFNQEDLADLLDEGVEKIYLCNGKFSVPLNISGKKYIGVADAEVYIGKDELQDFEKLGISFENVKFDEKYQKLMEEKKRKEGEARKAEEEHIRIQNSKKVGDVIKLGKYQGEEIEWKILDIQDGKALLLSKYALERKSFNISNDSVTWETSALRDWLNKEFYRSTFSRTEKESIVLSKVKAEKNPDFDTNPGNDTEDNVFLLNIQEAEKYFENDDERNCFPCDYIKKHYSKDDLLLFPRYNEKGCAWLLRSPGIYGNRSTCVKVGGSICYDGGSSSLLGIRKFFVCDDLYVRPAMYVDLSKL